MMAEPSKRMPTLVRDAALSPAGQRLPCNAIGSHDGSRGQLID